MPFPPVLNIEGSHPHLRQLQGNMAQFDAMLKPREAAVSLGVCLRTLLNWRRANYGPPYFEVGRRRYYDPEEIQKWVETRAHHVHPTR